jgi:hypothetical protein
MLVVMPFSTACSTSLTNVEAGLNYQDVDDPAVMVSNLYMFCCIFMTHNIAWRPSNVADLLLTLHNGSARSNVWHGKSCACCYHVLVARCVVSPLGRAHCRTFGQGSPVLQMVVVPTISSTPARDSKRPQLMSTPQHSTPPPTPAAAAVMSLQVSFPVKSAGAAAAGAAIEGSHLVAWTTTPWTLPSNLALCVHPELTYVQVRLQLTVDGP